MASLNHIRETYQTFPTFFDLRTVNISIAHVDCFIAKMEREQENPATVEEFESDGRSLNFLAYLYLRRFQHDKARPLVEGALQMEPCDVSALANKCEMHLQLFEITEAETTLQALEKQRENKRAIATSLADLAYGLSRIGPSTHLLSASKYAEAIEMGQGCCLPEKIVAWQYGIALNYNRSFDLEHILENPDVDVEENFNTAIAALSEVIKSEQKFFRPKAYVILGEITKKYWKDIKHVFGNMSTKMVTLPEERLTVHACFEKAYKLAPDDHWVLERFGRHLRHMKQHDRALEMLNMACDLCPTAFARHHQGLAYRSMANDYNKNAPLHRGRGCRGGRRNSRFRGSQYQAYGKDRGAHNSFTAGADPQYSPLPQQPIAAPASSGFHSVTGDANNNLDLAIVCIKKGIDLSNETAHGLWVTLAEIYSSMSKHEEADECFRKSLAENNYVTHLSRARTLESWGLAMEKRGMREKSHNYFRMAIEYAAKVKMTRRVAFNKFMQQLTECRNPTSKDLLNQSKFFELVGRHGEALSLLYEAHRMTPDPEVAYGIIKNLAAKKEYQKALTSCVMLQCTDAGDIIDDRHLVDISFGAVEQRMADLSVQTSHVLRNIYDRLLKDSCKKHEVFIFHDGDDNNVALAENVQALAKEMAQVECILLGYMPAGTYLLEIIAEVPEKYDAIIILVTPEFVKNDRTKKLCLHLLQESCVLCLRASRISENDIPKALKTAHQALLPEELYCEAFDRIGPLQKLSVWRDIFEHLWAAKNAAA